MLGGIFGGQQLLGVFKDVIVESTAQTFVGSDEYADIAVLKIDKTYVKKVAKIGNSENAKVGDTVCGWFGCNTIADMDAKLGENAAAVKRLASAKTETEFKKIYKEIFKSFF